MTKFYFKIIYKGIELITERERETLSEAYEHVLRCHRGAIISIITLAEYRGALLL